MRWLENDYAAQLREAGRRRRNGWCVRPGCEYTAGRWWLICGEQECCDWLAAAPADSVRHWQQMIPLADDPLYAEEAEATQPAWEWWKVTVQGVLLGAGIAVALFGLAMRLGWLQITA